MSALAVPLEPGDVDATTRSVRRILPSSISIITLVVVATTFVSDARSKIVSSVIGSGVGHDRAVADGFLVEDAVAAPDEHDGARQLLLADRLRDERLDRVELRKVERRLAGARRACGLNAARVGQLRGLRRKGDRGEHEQCSGRELSHQAIIDRSGRSSPSGLWSLWSWSRSLLDPSPES